MLHNLIDERYLEGPRNWSSSVFDNFSWVDLVSGRRPSDKHVDEMVQWCLKNCISKFIWGYKYPNPGTKRKSGYGFIFQNIYDAFAFKLRWI